MTGHDKTPLSRPGGTDVPPERVTELISARVAYIDSGLNYQYASAGFASELRVSPGSVIGKSVQDVIGEESFSKLLSYFKKALNGKRCRVLTSINSQRVSGDFEILLIPDTNESGGVNGFVMQLENEIPKSAPEHVRDHLESAAVPIHWVNRHGTITWANKAELELLGYDRSEYVGRQVSEFHCDKELIGDILRKLKNRETIANQPVQLRHKDGSVKTALLNSSVVRDNGKFVHASCFTIDITDQKKAEEARIASEFRYREILDSLPAAVYTCDVHGKIEMFNPAAAALWGRRPLIGTDLWCGSWKIFDPLDGSAIPLDECPMAITLKTGKPVYGRLIVVERPDRTRRTIAPHPRPIHDHNGQLTGAANMLIDVTDQVQAANVLRASEQKFRLICDLVPTTIWMTDDKGKVTYLNRRWTDITRREPDEPYGTSWVRFVHPLDREKAFRVVTNSVQEKQAFSFRFRYAIQNGYTLMRSTGTPFFDENGGLKGFIGIIQEADLEEKARRELEDRILERTKQLSRANEELIKSEERYHRMINEVQDYAIILLDQHGIVEKWNLGAEKIKGYQAEEIIGRHFREFYPHEEQVKGVPEGFLLEAMQNGRAAHEGWRVRKNGTRFWGSVVLTALHNELGELIGFSKVTRDLTERKYAHDALVAQNQQLERMNQELLTFAYVASHDLQEPLRKIQVFSNRILDTEGDNISGRSKEYFNIVMNSAGRMRLLIEDVLAYSRTNAEERKFIHCDLNAIVRDVLNELSSLISEKRARIENCELPAMKVIPFQFRQLIYNILTNSLKFCRNDVAPFIKVSYRMVAAAEFALAPEQKLFHRISVSDNGIGFDPLYKNKIFEVFQRLHTRNEFAGTGVGLAICKKIIENHGGVITAEGGVGAGATFHVFLPASGGDQQ